LQLVGDELIKRVQLLTNLQRVATQKTNYKQIHTTGLAAGVERERRNQKPSRKVSNRLAKPNSLIWKLQEPPR
jgi:hypothetical protein